MGSMKIIAFIFFFLLAIVICICAPFMFFRLFNISDPILTYLITALWFTIIGAAAKWIEISIKSILK